MILNGKIHYFYGHVPVRLLLVYQAGYPVCGLPKPVRVTFRKAAMGPDSSTAIKKCRANLTWDRGESEGLKLEDDLPLWLCQQFAIENCHL